MKTSDYSLLFSLPCCLAAASFAQAAVKPAPVFSDHMVLQQGIKVPVWGRATAGEDVTVSFRDQTVATKADAGGRWKVELKPLQASAEAAQLTIAGKNSVTFQDVLVGEVWVCSGQSNMEWQVSEKGVRVANADKEMAAANYPLIRHIKVPKRNLREPSDDFSAPWTVCTPETVGGYSGVAYFFARKLTQELAVPVGLVNCSYSGSPIEAWFSEETLQSDPACAPVAARRAEITAKWPETLAAYRQASDAWKKEAEEAKAAGLKFEKPKPQQPIGPGHPYMPVTVYNAMLHPVIPYAIRGVIWYQGEGNVSRPEEYKALFPALIRQWRKEWNEGDFPFYFVQLANFKGADPAVQNWPWLRKAQAETLSVPNTGMAVAIDIGNPDDIHPRNKQDVGLRLALLALAKTYHKSGLEFSGPVYKRCETAKGSVRVLFDHAQGLKSKTEELTGFEVAGSDQVFHAAAAKIEGASVIVSSPEVPNPVAVRYAWKNAPAAALRNGAELPAAPFRTDDWPK